MERVRHRCRELRGTVELRERFVAAAPRQRAAGRSPLSEMMNAAAFTLGAALQSVLFHSALEWQSFRFVHAHAPACNALPQEPPPPRLAAWRAAVGPAPALPGVSV